MSNEIEVHQDARLRATIEFIIYTAFCLIPLDLQLLYFSRMHVVSRDLSVIFMVCGISLVFKGIPKVLALERKAKICIGLAILSLFVGSLPFFWNGHLLNPLTFLANLALIVRAVLILYQPESRSPQQMS